MKHLIDFINETYINETVILLESIDNEIITESLNCTILRDLAKTLAYNKASKKIEYWWDRGSTFKDIFYNKEVYWDKITDADVTTYDVKDNRKALSLIRKIIKGDFDAIAIVYDKEDNFKAIYKPYGSPLNMLGRDMVGSHKPQYEKLSVAEGCKIDIIDISKYHSYELRRQRSIQKSGVIDAHDKDYLRKYAEENVKRYKDIIAKNRAEKIAEDDDTAFEVNNIVNKVMKLSIKVSENLDKYADKVYYLDKLLEMLHDKRKWNSGSGVRRPGYYSGQNGIFILFAEYVKALKEAKNVNVGSGWYGSHGEAKMKQVKSYKEALSQQIDKINKYIEENFNI